MSDEFEDDPTGPDEPVVAVQVAPKERAKTDEATKTRRQPPYNVILLNDEQHSSEYVIEMIVKIFGHSATTAEELTLRVHNTGRAIVMTTHRELAELKQQQVLSYGPDPRMSTSKGPVGCVIEASAG